MAATGPDDHVPVLLQDDVGAVVEVEHGDGVELGRGAAWLGHRFWVDEMDLEHTADVAVVRSRGPLLSGLLASVRDTDRLGQTAVGDMHRARPRLSGGAQWTQLCDHPRLTDEGQSACPAVRVARSWGARGRSDTWGRAAPRRGLSRALRPVSQRPWTLHTRNQKHLPPSPKPEAPCPSQDSLDVSLDVKCLKPPQAEDACAGPGRPDGQLRPHCPALG